MANLLGEIDVNIAPRQATYRRSIKDDARRKTRVLSPPSSGPRNRPFEKEISEPIQAINTPPGDEFPFNDNVLELPTDENNHGPESDPPLPSSPLAQATERKAQVQVAQDEDEDEEAMEISQVQGHANSTSANINMAGSRPSLRQKKSEPKKSDYPTPENSSPPRPSTETTIDASCWNNIASKLNVVDGPASDSALPGKLAPQDAIEDDGSLRFFWTDCTELNGNLLLFGKVKNRKNGTYVSCFVKVDNILRKLFFLPRSHRHKHGRETSEEVEMGDVFEEVDQLMSRYGVGMHKIKPCSRKYAFELPNVPPEAEYLKLLYPYDKQSLPMDLQGETFSRVFGTNTSLFEQFVLWKNIKGPCWLTIQDADFSAVNNASWCKLEVLVQKPTSIEPLKDSENLEAPSMTLMSLALRTSMNQVENKQEIIMASARIYENVSLTDTTPADQLPCRTFTVIRPPAEGFPTGFKNEAEKHKGTIRLERSEQALLSIFLAQLQKVDPDVLVGHRLEDLDYSILLSRMRERKTPGWHRIGRLRRHDWPKNFGKGGGSFFAERQLVAGRLLCDLGNDMGKVSLIVHSSASIVES